jgi:beta-1,4-mannosyl-glycoprotein beta-1,4-N-acetylglucosaminyltransferase
MYFDEDLLLDLRLNCLNKYVKKFIITEATYTHNGNKKNLQFDINKFPRFKDKITYLVVEDEPRNILELDKHDTKEKRGEKLILNGMARDYYQRESLKKGLTNLSSEDLILISDLDEIPNLDNLDMAKINNNIIIFEQKMFYYKFNLLYENFTWQGSKGVKSKNFLSPQWLRNIKGKSYPKWRLDTYFSKKKYSNLYFVKNGGWHFSCIRTPEDLQKKLKNFAHHYEFEESGLQIKDLTKMIREQRAVYDYQVDMKKNKWIGQKQLSKTQISQMPFYIQQNLEKYKDWLC